MIKIITAAIFSIVLLNLSGCLATTNLLEKNNGLPDELHSIATEMVNIAKRRCVKVTGRQGTPEEIKGRVMDSNDWTVSRFYLSNSGWYKGTAMSRGVIDDLFYNKSTGQFVCGDHGWKEFSNSGEIKFLEYGSKSKILIKSDNYKSSITQFRETGLSQIKYASDEALCSDLKFMLKIMLEGAPKVNSSDTVARMARISEMTKELANSPLSETVYSECQERYFLR